MRIDEQIQTYTDGWDNLPMEPLRITMIPASGVSGYGDRHFDGLLAAMVVQHALRGERLEASVDPYDIPLPLQCAWRSSSGLPLWASTDLLPVGEKKETKQTWVRRQVPSQLARLEKSGRPYALRATQGPFKDMMIPMPVTVAQSFQCDVIGNARVIADLLNNASHVGKKRWCGVQEWRIEQIPTFSLIKDGKLRRPIPFELFGTDEWTELLGTGFPLNVSYQLLGWTPPYWLANCQSHCFATGTPFQVVA